jgi:four helix bundle protein
MTTPTPPNRLETRTAQFALDVRKLIHKVSTKDFLSGDAQELLQCSGALGSTYVAASEAPSKKAFAFFIRSALTQAKQACYWLKLLDAGEASSLTKERDRLVDEAESLLKIFGASLRTMRAKAEAVPA